eukprot:1956935-Alexandrium_andersonii.AAC.1
MCIRDRRPCEPGGAGSPTGRPPKRREPSAGSFLAVSGALRQHPTGRKAPSGARSCLRATDTASGKLQKAVSGAFR